MPKTLKIAATVLAAQLALSATSNGAVTVTISDQGSDLLVTYSGSIDLTGGSALIIGQNNDPSVTFDPDRLILTNGASPVTRDLYDFTGTVPPLAFGTSTDTFQSFNGGAGDITGDPFGWLDGFNLVRVVLPGNYSSGDPINGSFVVFGESVSSLGIFGHTIVLPGGGDSIIINGGTVPEPSSALLLGLGGLGVLLRRRRK